MDSGMHHPSLVQPPQDRSTWEPPQNIHPEALEDFEWRRQLPFALSELLELPPHAPLQVLAREGLLRTSMPRAASGLLVAPPLATPPTPP